MDRDVTRTPAGLSESSPRSVPLGHALSQFVTAARTGQGQAICSSWQQVRNAANGMRLGQILQLAGPGESAARLGDLLVAAHAQQGCYMCESGVVTCDACSGRGLNDDGRKCTSCDGRGIAVCGFCRGTGWADMDLIPPELRQAVAQKRYLQVKADIKRLGELCAKLDLSRLARMDHAGQQAFVRTLLHVHSRCLAVADDELTAQEHRLKMHQAAAKIEQVLEATKVRTATGAPAQ